MLEKLLKQKAMIITILIAVMFGGIYAYTNMSKLEDAEIPIKSAVVYTIYPGATAHEVELEVTDVLEKAIQRLGNIEDIVSVSMPGVSRITVNISPSVKTPQLPQMWDHLRRKVGDASQSLPSGAMAPIVNDDFADVYGMFYAVTSDGYSLQELNDYVEFIKRELLDVPGVKRAQIYGHQSEAIDVRFSAEKLANLGINPMQLAMAIQNQGGIVRAGSVNSGSELIRLGVGSKIKNIDEIRDLLIQVSGDKNFRLGDIAIVKRSVLEPLQESMTYNGQMAMSLGLSNESGVNVVKLGKAIKAKLEMLKKDLPLGIEVCDIYSQPERVEVAVNDFMLNLLMSIGIVILVLLFAMGLRSGLLIASGLVFTIFGTLLVMMSIGLPLHRITLGAIIIAMGMLVDNSIVVADGILIDLKRGMDRKKAFVWTAQRTALPLLGATLVAILAFLPLRLSPNAAGEFLSSLFTVLTISLILSWVFAMIQTPFMAKLFYRKERPEGENPDPFGKGIYPAYRKIVEWVLSHKIMFLVGSFAVLFIALANFKHVKMDFMSKMNYNQFIVEFTLPQGSNIESVQEDILNIGDHATSLENVEKVTTAIFRPPGRYTLMRPLATGGNNYGELIIDTQEAGQVNEVIEQLRVYTDQHYPQAITRFRLFGAAFNDYEIEVEFSGPDPAVLRQLTNQAKAFMNNEPSALNVTDNWSNQAKVLTPQYSIEKAQRLGLSRQDMANSLLVATDGMPIGAIYEGINQLPIVLKLDQSIDANIDDLASIPVWGQYSESSVPLGQIQDDLTLSWENELVNRYNGKRAMKAQCDAVPGVLANELQAILIEDIEAIKLPDGYTLRWDGTVGSASEAQGSLFKFLPLALGLMLIIIIGLFNNFRQPAIIFLIVPFAFVGIVFGFVTTGQTLSFVGIIGALGLIGMMIKNSVVLLDELNINIREGKSPLQATIAASVSRMRPVMMASLTTILGMVPLLWDVMFNSLAITIMFGLLFGSLITLFVVPVMYAVFYKIDVKPLRIKKISKK
jgi:multidrug efflux pump subunit AcrB